MNTRSARRSTTLRVLVTLCLAGWAAAYLVFVGQQIGADVRAAFARRAASGLLALAALAALGGCASLPAPQAAPRSVAVADTGATALQRSARTALAAEAPERSGFRVLADGPDAFDARIALVRRAEGSVDVQTYLLADDRSGRAFTAELARAAARGVRVRLLVDDLYATGQDARWAALAAQPGVEVRLFNPLPARAGGVARRVAFSMHAWPAIHRRMHNKLMTVDGAFAIVGGRNVADAYFDRGAGPNFIDLDVLAAGPVVAGLGAAFDRYWNAPAAYPIGRLVARTDGIDLDAATLRDAEPLPTAAAWADAFERGTLGLEPGDATVLADDPRKVDGDADAATVAPAYERLLAGAATRVVATSPYVIPAPSTFAVLHELQARAVAVSLLTNSMASTDEPLVHIGYARHRAALLRAGVELRELVGAGRAGDGAALHRDGSIGSAAGSSGSESGGRLHAKVAVVDGAVAFVGSMNMDPRSARHNTEAAVVIRSAPVAAQIEALLRERAARESLRVVLRDGSLLWLRDDGGPALTAEPGPANRPMPAARLMVRLFGDGLL